MLEDNILNLKDLLLNRYVKSRTVFMANILICEIEHQIEFHMNQDSNCISTQKKKEIPE